jgi:hypothetical protein
MFRLVFALVLAWIAVAGSPYPAAAAQTLTVRVADTGPQVNHLASYVPDVPIDVTVEAPGARTVALAGLGPDGSNVRFPLAQVRGVFAGTATFAVAGTWSLAVATTADGPEILGESFPIVVAPGPSSLQIGGLIALALVSIGGGVGLIAAARQSAGTRVPA